MERFANTITTFQGTDGELHFTSSDGGHMGKSEFPRIFMAAFEEVIDEVITIMPSSVRMLTLQEPFYDGEVIGGVTAFAGDVAHPIPTLSSEGLPTKLTSLRRTPLRSLTANSRHAN